MGNPLPKRIDRPVSRSNVRRFALTRRPASNVSLPAGPTRESVAQAMPGRRHICGMRATKWARAAAVYAFS
jgi:hypothetical protein